jgi:hypothetical protein
MREFTKSMASFSWAMSLFGAQQLVNVLSPQKATQAFDAVTNATKEQFGKVLEPTFKAGDAMGRGMVDMMFGFLTLQALNPSWWAKMTSETMQRSVELFRQAMPGDPSRSQQESSGWGPVK